MFVSWFSSCSSGHSLAVMSTFFHLLLIFCPSTVGFGHPPETLTFLSLVSLLPTIESLIVSLHHLLLGPSIALFSLVIPLFSWFTGCLLFSPCDLDNLCPRAFFEHTQRP